MVGEQDALCAPERAGNDAPLIVGHGYAGPFGEVRGAMEHRAVHMDGFQRRTRSSKGRSVRSVCMHYGLHVGPFVVDPDMESHAGVRAPAAQRLQVLVDEYDALARRLLESVAELQRPERARLVRSRGDLARQAGLMIFSGEDAAATREQLGHRQVERGQIRVHLAAHPREKILLALHLMWLGSQVERIGRAIRMARRTQSIVMNGKTPRKMTRVGT